MFWNVRAIPAATRAWVGLPVMSAPSNRTRPDVGAVRPAITFTMVLFPEPLGPIRPRISPLASWKDTPSTALTPPKCLARLSTSSTERAPPSLDQALHRRHETTARHVQPRA